MSPTPLKFVVVNIILKQMHAQAHKYINKHRKIEESL